MTDRAAYINLMETLRAQWPEVNFFIRSSSINRRNYINENYATPWVSINYKDKIGQSTDYGADNYSWIQEVDILYVSPMYSASGTAGSGYDMTSHLLNRLTNAAVAVMSHSGTGYQVNETPTISVNELDSTNLRNTNMMQQLIAGTLKIKMIVGRGNFT